MKRTRILLLVTLLCVMGLLSLDAQISSMPDYIMKANFEAQVKSLDEFINRYNGKETKPGIDNDQDSRARNVVSLFDFQMDKRGLSDEQFSELLRSFVTTSVSEGFSLDPFSRGIISECLCLFKYNGKKYRFKVFFQREPYLNETYRWAISAVSGLNESGIYDPLRFYRISPIEHEIHFLGLDDIINANPSQSIGLRSREAKIDELSVFLALALSGALKFEVVEHQSFYFLDVPGFMFKIDEISRDDTNSGWLITELQPLPDKDKTSFIQKLFHNEK